MSTFEFVGWLMWVAAVGVLGGFLAYHNGRVDGALSILVSMRDAREKKERAA